jgi:hypothetical protein
LITAAQQDIFHADPVLWAREYLQDILETIEASPEDEHSLALLSLEKEELRQIWQALSAGAHSGPVFCGFGLPGARLFVIHQLLAAMPAPAPPRQQSNAAALGKTCRHFLELFFFLSAFAPPLSEKAPEPAAVERALRLGRRLLPGPSAGGQRLHLYCLDYRLPAPACYLPFSHTLAYGTGTPDRDRQLRYLLRHFVLARQAKIEDSCSTVTLFGLHL